MASRRGCLTVATLVVCFIMRCAATDCVCPSHSSCVGTRCECHSGFVRREHHQNTTHLSNLPQTCVDCKTGAHNNCSRIETCKNIQGGGFKCIALNHEEEGDKLNLTGIISSVGALIIILILMGSIMVMIRKEGKRKIRHTRVSTSDLLGRHNSSLPFIHNYEP